MYCNVMASITFTSKRCVSEGIRIDTVPYVNKQFWKQFKTTALPDTYCVGEVLVDRSSDLNYVSGYQT